MKLIKQIACAIALCATSINAFAISGDFEVAVDVDKPESVLTMELIQAMKFPSLKITPAIKEGDYCYTSNRSNTNALCSGHWIGQSASLMPALHTFDGTPHATFSLQLTNPAIKNGLQLLTSFNGGASSVVSMTSTLDGSGDRSAYVYGYLTLRDYDATKTEAITFVYNLTANYN